MALLVSLVACTRNPATGERQFSLISREQEIQIGEQGAREVEATLGLVDDPALQEYVSNIGMRLAKRSERPELPWEFGVIDDPTPNAFALPGGKIYVTRGMMSHMNNEAQLAGVLGHEIGHVTARHSAEQISKAQLAQVGLGLSAVFIEPARELLPLASAGLSVLFLKFGREDEYQADELGLRYASQGDYDLKEVPEVFAMLKEVSEAEGAGRVPEWLSTHPHPENRIERLEQGIAELSPKVRAGEVDRQQYLRQLDGLVYGPDPRDGYFRGDRFYHPQLRFGITMPESWQRQNYAEAVVAVSPSQDAMVQLTASDARDPQSALGEFARQQGVTIGEPADLLDELPAASAGFVAEAQSGVLRGLVTYVTYADHTYQIVSVAPEGGFGQYAETFSRIHGSFESVTDPQLLNVEPAEIEIVRVDRPVELATLYQRQPATIPLERIALLNQMQPDAQLRAGQLVKWVRQ